MAVDGLDIDEAKDGLIIYEETTDRTHYLNATASIIFVLCDGQNTTSEIVNLIAMAFGLDASPEAQVEKCIATLTNEGLLR